MKKCICLALIVLLIALGVMYVGDNPDWTLPVSIRAQEISNLTVDIASQSLDELNIRITSQSTPITIEPASGVTFNITGDVNATIEGTASVSIDNATIEVGVATVKERASEAGKIEYADDFSGSISGSGGTYTATLYTNTHDYTVYLEMITFNVFQITHSSTPYPNTYFLVEFILYDSSGSVKAKFYANPGAVLNFDPAIPLEPGDYIEWTVYNYGDVANAYASVIVRLP